MNKHSRHDPYKDWAPPDVVKKLRDQLEEAQFDVVSLATRNLPPEVGAALRGYSDCKNQREFINWRYAVVDQIIAVAKPDPASRKSLYDGERGYRPLCGGGATDIYGGGFHGYTLPEGLNRHLTGYGNTYRCDVMKHAFAATHDHMRPTLDAENRQKREDKEARRKTERLYKVDDGEPSLIDDHMLDHRTFDEISAVEERLRSLGFVIEERDNIVSYRLPHPDYLILADPREPRRLNFRLFKLTPSGKARRRKGEVRGASTSICPTAGSATLHPVQRNARRSLRAGQEELEMSDDDDKKPLRLVSSQPGRAVAEVRAKSDADYEHQLAAQAMETFIVNLLRVIAGAGQPYSVITEMHDAFVAWQEWHKAAEAAGQPKHDTSGLFTLHDLFPERRWKPQTEAEWDQWLASDFRRRRLRRRAPPPAGQSATAVLREIASKVTGHPALPKHAHEVTDAMEKYGTLRERHRTPQLRRLNERDIDIHARAVARLREQASDGMIAGLRADQVAALAAVAAGTPEGFEPFDAFMFDVLGRMGLLQRKPNGRKSKRHWDLSEAGRLALERRRGGDSRMV